MASQRLCQPLSDGWGHLTAPAMNGGLGADSGNQPSQARLTRGWNRKVIDITTSCLVSVQLLIQPWGHQGATLELLQEDEGG